MSSKRRKTEGFMPIDNLSETSRVQSMQMQGSIGVLKRHNSHRDPRVMAKVNGNLHGELLSQNTEKEVSVREEGSKRESAGLLADNDQNTHVSYTVSGEISTIDARNEVVEQSKCLLVFRNDKAGTRIDFRYKEQNIGEAQIDLQSDCRAVLFDAEDRLIAFVLQEPRLIRIDSRMQTKRAGNDVVEPTYIIQWRSGDLTKIGRIRQILKQLKICKVSVGAAAEEKRGDYLPSLDKAAHLMKLSFRSLDKHRRSPQPSLPAYRIRVPSSPEREPQNIPRKLSNITPKSFYSSSKSNTTINHAFSNTRQTRSQTPNLVQSKLFSIDDEKDYEVPQKFSPRLCYKFHDGAGYTITNQDFKCLYNHDWINDTILDFFTKYYVEKAIEESIVAREKVHIMSSFFYTKLVSDPTNYYGNVQNWVTNCDLFNKQYVVVPINMNFHWFGCIITNLDAILCFFEKLSDNEKKQLVTKQQHESTHLPNHNDQGTARGQDIVSQLSSRSATPRIADEDDDSVSISAPIIRILTFDSLRQTHSREIDPIKDFLIAYARDKYSLDLDKSLIKMRTCAVPQQPNMSDCGVHVILNTRKFFENPASTIEVWRSAKSKSKSSSRIINEYFEKNKRSTARRDLREVLLALQKEQVNFMRENKEDPFQGESSEVEDDGEEGDIEIIEDLSKIQTTLTQSKGTSSDLAEESRVETGSKEKPSSQENGQILISSSTKDCEPEINTQSAGQFQQYGLRGSSKKVTNSTIGEVSNRKYLESSPVRESSQVRDQSTASGNTSPYFGTSSLKSRSTAFDADGATSRSFHKLEERRELERMTQPPSSVLSEFPLAEKDNHDRSRSSSFSDDKDSRMTISEKIDDSDVNLLGFPDKDSSIRLSKNIKAEINDPIIGETEQTFMIEDEPSYSKATRRNVRDAHRGFQENSTPDPQVPEKSSPGPNDDIQSIASDSE